MSNGKRNHMETLTHDEMRERIDSYIDAHTDAEGDYLHALYRATNIHTIHGRMASGHIQGRLLKMIVEMEAQKHPGGGHLQRI